MNYVRNGAYWGILYAIAGWFWQYGALLTGNLPPSDSMAYMLLVNTEPGAELFTSIIIWSVIGAIIGAVVWGIASAANKEDGGKPKTVAAGKRRISRLALVTLVMFLLAVVSSWYATAQMVNLRA